MRAKAALTWLTGQGDAVTATGRITVILASAAILAAAVLSYTALYDLFLAIGLFGAGLALLFPILFDVVEVAAAVDVLNAKLQGQEDAYSWRLVILFTALGIVANVAHAAHAWHTGRIDTAQMALAIGATSLFPLSVAMVTHLLKLSITRSLDRRQLVTTRAELTDQIDRARQELDQLTDQIDLRRQTLDRLNDDIKAGHLGSKSPNGPLLDRANEARQMSIEQRRDRVLVLAQQDLTQKEIADRLDVSPSTIKRDLAALNGKVGG